MVNSKTQFELKNYSIFDVISKIFVFGLFYILLFFILEKIVSNKASTLVLILLIILTLFKMLISWKTILINETCIEEKYVFFQKKTYYYTKELYINSFYPPAASCSSEKIQLRTKKGDKLIIEFKKEENIGIYNYLKNQLNIQIKKWQ